MRSSLIISLTLVIALLLSVMPMSNVLELGRPMWLAMVLAYWVMALPHRVGLLTAWITGLATDVLYGQLFGQHALVMTLVAWMMLLLHQRIRRFPLWQQSLVMLPVLGIAQMLLLWLNSLTGNRPPTLLFLLPAVVSALLWPWVYSVLRGVRKRFHVL
ncbi:rod shape-determining protein MreD [Halopseudomonas sp.]|jgi:rod shape-determining protein MreD|uniref:rod shape-determining protein MreD n=1 Tax=Halopseudomonas sp. TaxID=2901191 RepID=UPI001A4EF10B|nr:rod shape-determining protein MreD [Pseudomonas sp.]|tara:strand:- start:2618 stop:3091 length:474 start_codon:yes stop_codon:yes gene_type:complete